MTGRFLPAVGLALAIGLARLALGSVARYSALLRTRAVGLGLARSRKFLASALRASSKICRVRAPSLASLAPSARTVGKIGKVSANLGPADAGHGASRVKLGRIRDKFGAC